jgi:hypothetical protein
MFKNVLACTLALVFCVPSANAQRADVTISLNEAFFDTFLDSVFTNFEPPSFSIAASASPATSSADGYVGGPSADVTGDGGLQCGAIKVLREMDGVRTAVRFRDGRIAVPLAFTGDYRVPLLGCVEFTGWAESIVDLEFDRPAQRLVGRIRVLNVNMSGSRGIGGSTVARMLQNSIDKRMNPIQIMTLESISFGVPVQNSGTLRMKAVDVRTAVTNGGLTVTAVYEFSKG